MSDSATTPSGRRPTERFGPTSGQVSGYTGLVLAAVTVGYVAVEVPTTTGLKVALGALLFASLAWAVVLRPRVHVYGDRLVLRNAFRDTHIPWSAVEHVTLGQALTVWAGGERYLCLGVGRSARTQMRAERRRALAAHHGAGEAVAAATAHDLARDTHVVHRLRDLAEAAQRDTDAVPGSPAGVRETWAWLEVAMVSVAGVALAVSLLL